MIFHIRWTLAAILSLVLVAGCGSDSRDDNGGAGREAGADGLASTKSVEKVVGPEGGEIDLEGATLSVPAGALDEATKLRMTATDLAAPAGYLSFSRIYKFEPEGLEFHRPLTVTLPFQGAATNAGLIWSKLGLPGYDRLEGTAIGAMFSGLVVHFSIGFVGRELEAIDAGPDSGSADRLEPPPTSDAQQDAYGDANGTVPDTGTDVGPALEAGATVTVTGQLTWNRGILPNSPCGVLGLGTPPLVMAALADRELLAVGSQEGLVKVISTTDGHDVQAFGPFGGPITAVAFSQDGNTLVSGGDDGTIRVWATSLSSPPEISWHAHDSGLGALQFSSDGTVLVSGDAAGIVKVWRVSDHVLLQQVAAHVQRVTALAVAPNGMSFASGSEDDTARLWKTDGTPLLTLAGHGGAVRGLAFSSAGDQLASASADKTLKLWRLADGTNTMTLIGHTGAVNEVGFVPGAGQLASGSADSTIKVWRLSDGAEIRTMSHGDVVSALSVSSDGSRIVSVSPNGTALRWTVATGAQQRAFSNHYGAIATMKMSRDGSVVVTGSHDGTARLWDTARLTSSAALLVTGTPVDVVLSSDRSKAAVTSDGSEVDVFRTSDGALLRKVTLAGFQTTGADFSADGTQLVVAAWDHNNSADSTMVIAYDVGSGAELARYKTSGEYGGAKVLAYSPTGAELAGGGPLRSAACVWMTQNGASSCLPPPPRGQQGTFGSSIAYSTDGTLLTAGGGGGDSYPTAVQVWNRPDGQLIRNLAGHDTQAIALAFSSDGQWFASATAGNASAATQNVKLWHLGGTEAGPFLDLDYRPVVGTALVFSPDSSLVAGVSSYAPNDVAIWETRASGTSRDFSGHTAQIRSIDFSLDGTKVASGASDKTVRIWNAATGASLHTFSGHTADVLSVAFLPDGRVLSGGAEGSLRIWNDDGTARTLSLEPNPVVAVASSPDGTLVAGCMGPQNNSGGVVAPGTLKIWRLSDGAIIGNSDCGSSLAGTKVSFSRDGTLLIAGGPMENNAPIGIGARVVVLRSPDWTVFRRLVLPTESNYNGAIAISSDGKSIAVGKRDSSIEIRNSDDGVPIFELNGHLKPVDTVQISDDKALVFSADIDEARLWRVADGALLDKVQGGVRVVADGAIARIAVANGNSVSLSCKRP